MLIDCDTCTARGTGCGDCVVTVLLGAPPGWEGADPVVVPMTARPRGSEAPAARVARGSAAGSGHDPADGLTAEDVVVPPPGVVVEFDEVERRAVRALADGGLVPPLRHRSHPDDRSGGGADRGSRTG
jgi:hypothetical protein